MRANCLENLWETVLRKKNMSIDMIKEADK